MSNDPYGDGPSDRGPGGWGQDPAPGGWGQDPGPNAGQDPVPPPGWGQEPMPSGGRPASVAKRFGAFLLDSIGLSIVITIVLLFTGLGGNMLATDGGSAYLQGVIRAIVLLAYVALMEAGSGQTIAKRLLNIKVVSEDGSQLTMEKALLRRVPFVIGSFLPTFIGGLVSFGLLLAILITAIQDQMAHQGIHDKWAKTRVIDV